MWPRQAPLQLVLESASMIWLASNSPRRRELMALGGWDFTVAPADVDETPLPGEAPAAYVRRLAVEKARAVGVRLAAGGAPHGEADLIVAADTTVAELLQVAGGPEAILGKPSGPQEAEAMLRRLRGRPHRVYTGLAVLRLADNRLFSDLCETQVFMRSYSDGELAAYVASGDPLDKAGAYAIQHRGFHPVERLAGCYANVMGLPLCALGLLLAQAGQPSPLNGRLPQACAGQLPGDLNLECPYYPLEPASE